MIFFYDDNVIQEIVEKFKTLNYDILYGNMEIVYKNDLNKIYRYWAGGRFLPFKLKLGWMPPHPALFLRTSIAKDYEYDIGYNISADYDLFLRIQNDPRINLFYLPEVLVCMRTGGHSNKNLGNIYLKMKEDYRAITNNNIGGLGTLAIKNIRKIPQIFK